MTKHTKSNNNGLTSERVKEKLKQFGKNVLPHEKPYSKIRLFLNQFNSSLMYILLTTVIISFFLKHYTDSIFIIIVLLINTIVGFWQENKANNSLAALKQMVKIRAKVFRSGLEKEIDSEELVPGDVVLLRAGDKVPADGRIIECKNLKINESSLTGEWLAVEKAPSTSLPEGASVAEKTNMVFMGTIVEEGTAEILITSTGVHTEIGAIVTLLKETKETKTPLQKKITSLSRILGGFILVIIVIIVVEGLLTGESFADIFVTALALAVSAIPEGLLPAVTVILVLGMRRILKKKGLVRKLSSTEALGSVTVICTDKTGTLTEGNMQVSHILTSTKELMKAGLEGLAEGEKSNGVESHIKALKVATMVNDAFIENPDDELKEWIVRGKPTDKALLMAGMQSGLNKYELEKKYPPLDRVAFTSEYKFAASLYKKSAQQNMLYVIGAPERILERATAIDIDGRKKKLAKAEIKKLNEKMDSLTEKGLRVLACAQKDYASKTKYKDLSELITGLNFIGLIAIKDPLREDAKKSILTAQKAGIKTVIITGDHKLTAKAIAEEIGIKSNEKNIIEGKSLESLSDDDLREKVKTTYIYARVAPHHKLRIVQALQANGEIVAMLGDGVNDAPAIKTADIGVVVGSGTDVAKEVADLVLLDDNFKTVIKAIEQGRVVFQNVRKVFIYLVADDFSELFLFLTNMALGLPLPLLPAQILWINLIEDGFPAIALTTEQETKGIMEEKPRDPKEPLLNRSLKKWMAAIFFITGIAALTTFLIILNTTGDVAKARTITFALMCFDSLTFAFIVRSFKQSIFRKNIFSNRYLVSAVGVAFLLLLAGIYVPLLQKLLGTEAIGLLGWALIITVSLIEVLLIEFSKKKIFTRF
ncbi:MAG: HAD-IC family P-type ATPase [Candidatus Staskawiczbacteria bacterium]|nr:HAD-IC family P-type ATPase [Candidatus Staskawiczbacteria bacterium]